MKSSFLSLLIALFGNTPHNLKTCLILSCYFQDAICWHFHLIAGNLGIAANFCCRSHTYFFSSSNAPLVITLTWCFKVSAMPFFFFSLSLQVPYYCLLLSSFFFVLLLSFYFNGSHCGCHKYVREWVCNRNPESKKRRKKMSECALPS